MKNKNNKCCEYAIIGWGLGAFIARSSPVYYSIQLLFPTSWLPYAGTGTYLWVSVFGRVSKTKKFYQLRHIPEIDLNRAMTNFSDDQDIIFIATDIDLANELIELYPGKFIFDNTNRGPYGNKPYVRNNEAEAAKWILVTDDQFQTYYEDNPYISLEEDRILPRGRGINLHRTYDDKVTAFIKFCFVINAINQAWFSYISVLKISWMGPVSGPIFGVLVGAFIGSSIYAFRINNSMHASLCIVDQFPRNLKDAQLLYKNTQPHQAINFILLVLASMGLARYYSWDAMIIGQEYHFSDPVRCFFECLSYICTFITTFTSTFFIMMNVNLVELLSSIQTHYNENHHFALLTLGIGFLDAILNGWGVGLTPHNNTFEFVMNIFAGVGFGLNYLLFNVIANAVKYAGEFDDWLENDCSSWLTSWRPWIFSLCQRNDYDELSQSTARKIQLTGSSHTHFRTGGNFGTFPFHPQHSHHGQHV